MKRLIYIGLCKVGEWGVLGGRLGANLNILYSFILGTEVLYIGKTTQTLQTRLYGSPRPGPAQNTNLKGNKLLLELLGHGKCIDIFALPDDGLHQIGAFDLNLAAGLEDSIISVLKPRWNGTLK